MLVHHQVEQKKEKTNSKVSLFQHCMFINFYIKFLTLTIFLCSSLTSRMTIRRSKRNPSKKGLKKNLFPGRTAPTDRPPPAKKKVSKKQPLKDLSNDTSTAISATTTPGDIRSKKLPIVNPYAKKKVPPEEDSKPAAVANFVAPAIASSEVEIHRAVEPTVLAPVVPHY